MTHSWRVAPLVGHMTELLILIGQIVQMHLLHWMQPVKNEGFRNFTQTHWLAIYNQRTNGPVNAHLISWPSKAQNIQNLENIW